MKRFYIPFLIMAAAAVAACQNKTAVEEPTSEQGSYVFTIKATSSDIETKTDYDTDGKFSWSSGDQISVLFHNGDENKFFTLTTTGSGASADFSGTIEEGYVIGASDGTDTDKKIWALFPASDNHVYTAGSNPSFFTPAETDFTVSGAHFSANIPMYALGASENNEFTFANLACTYKFIIKNLDSSVNRVKLVVQNQESRGLSGSWAIHDDMYINYEYATGTPKSTITYINNVSNNQAVFYVSCRYYGDFRPIVTVINAENDYILTKRTASIKQTPNSMNIVKPITISAPGTGTAPIFDGINWSDSNVATSTLDEWQQSTIGLTELKVIASTQYMFVRVKGAQSSITGNNFMDIYLSDGAEGEYVWGDYWRTTGSVIYKKEHKGTVTDSNLSMTFNGSTIETKTESSGSDIFWFMAIPRDAHSLLQSAGTVYVGVSLWTGWSISGMIPSRRTYDHDSYLMNVSLP